MFTIFMPLRVMLATLFLCILTGAKAQTSIPTDTVILLQRGNCEDECEIYRVMVFANGDVIWHGRGRVRTMGVALGHIEKEKVRAIIKSFESVDYFKLENIYGYMGKGCPKTTDGQALVVTSLSVGGVSKTIMHYLGCAGEVSEKLKALEDNIDRIANTEHWIQ
jgi:hypothetical protein